MNAPTKPSAGKAAKVSLFDSLFNLVSGLGTAKDKNYATQYSFNLLDRAQIEAAYRGDWIARKIVDLPAKDATREWRDWQADQSAITKIEGVEKKLGIKKKLMRALANGRLYGGGGLIIGTGDGDSAIPLDVNKVQADGLKYVHVISKWSISAGEIEYKVDSEWFGSPQYYNVQNPGQTPIRVHPSRLVRFVGLEMPDIALVADGWGDSILQSLDEAVKHAGICAGGIATLVQEAKVDVIKIPNLMDQVQTVDYKTKLMERLGLANTAKSLLNTLLLDKEEDWERINQNFTGLPDIFKLYLLVACGAADIPATRMLGQSAVGLGATGEGDLRNYYDNVGSEQKNVVTPAIGILDECIIRSALGSRDAGIHYNWTPLWQMDEQQSAELAYKKAQTFKIDVDSNVLDPEVLREGRYNQLVEDGFYPGIDEAIEELDNANVDETDPEVKAAFGEGGEIKPAGDEIQKQALNGTQISSLQEIIAAVGTHDLPPDSAKALIAVAFPSLEPPEIDAMVDPMIGFEVPPKPAPMPFGPDTGPTDPNAPVDPNAPPKPLKKPVLKLVGQDTIHIRMPSIDSLYTGKQVRELADELAKYAVNDAPPRTLYVRRDVLNAADIVKWAKSVGFEKTIEASAMHVTIAFSRAEVDWMEIQNESWDQDEKGRVHVAPGGPRLVERLGDTGQAVVLMFASSILCYRHEQIKCAGATWDWPEYQPHITLSFDAPGIDVRKIEPYRGAIELGPEIFEEVKEDWKAGITEDGAHARIPYYW